MSKSTVETNTFGVPLVRNVPAPRKKSRGWRMLKRTVIVLLSFFLLLPPGIFFLYITYLAYVDAGLSVIFIPFALGVIFTGGGLAGVISGIRG